MDVDANLSNPPGLTAFHTSDYFDYLRRGRHHDRLPGSAVGIVGPDGGGGVGNQFILGMGNISYP